MPAFRRPAAAARSSIWRTAPISTGSARRSCRRCAPRHRLPTSRDMVPCAPQTRRRVVLLRPQDRARHDPRLQPRASHEIIDIDECPISLPEIVAALDRLRVLAGIVCATPQPFHMTVTATASGLDIAVDGSGKLGEDRRRAAVRFRRQRRLRPAVGRWRDRHRAEQAGHRCSAASRSRCRPAPSCRRPPPPSRRWPTSCSPSRARQEDRRPFCRLRQLCASAGAQGAKSMRSRATPQRLPRSTGLPRGTGLKRVTVERRDLFRRPLTFKELNAFDGVVFDPPRAGAEDQSKQIARSDVPLVAAVSCNPARSRATFDPRRRRLRREKRHADRPVPVVAACRGGGACWKSRGEAVADPHLLSLNFAQNAHILILFVQLRARNLLRMAHRIASIGTSRFGDEPAPFLSARRVAGLLGVNLSELAEPDRGRAQYARRQGRRAQGRRRLEPDCPYPCDGRRDGRRRTACGDLVQASADPRLGGKDCLRSRPRRQVGQGACLSGGSPFRHLCLKAVRVLWRAFVPGGRICRFRATAQPALAAAGIQSAADDLCRARIFHCLGGIQSGFCPAPGADCAATNFSAHALPISPHPKPCRLWALAKTSTAANGGTSWTEGSSPTPTRFEPTS